MRVLFAFVILAIAGCATTVPDAIRLPPTPDISVAQVRANPSAHANQRIRWGGTIARVSNHETTTDLEIVARELTSSGRPRQSDHSAGRFIARVAGFLDPAVYSEGRQATVTGVVVEETSGRIGEHKYRYPLVKADTVYLWEPLRELPDRHPHYYDPFYDPFWYPWRPWPYYYPYYH